MGRKGRPNDAQKPPKVEVEPELDDACERTHERAAAEEPGPKSGVLAIVSAVGDRIRKRKRTSERP